MSSMPFLFFFSMELKKNFDLENRNELLNKYVILAILISGLFVSIYSDNWMLLLYIPAFFAFIPSLKDKKQLIFSVAMIFMIINSLSATYVPGYVLSMEYINENHQGDTEVIIYSEVRKPYSNNYVSIYLDEDISLKISTDKNNLNQTDFIITPEQNLSLNNFTMVKSYDDRIEPSLLTRVFNFVLDREPYQGHDRVYVYQRIAG